MFVKRIIHIILLVSFPLFGQAQELVTGLQVNRLVKGNKYPSAAVKADGDVIELPFIDDFSGESFMPDPRNWSDNNVFINNTYTDKQITKGVATFDALDSNGRLYETISPSGFEADHLTSRPINLNFRETDNIWMSFFYQPGGLGDMPEQKDSLTLQFYAPDEARWYSVWRAAGGVRQDRFKPAIIRIDNERYLKSGFRFRFINRASLNPDLSDPSIAGNCDHWHLDYVYINRNRNGADTIPADVAFTTPLRSMLKTYEAMPWKQFRQVFLQEMGASIPIHYRNNDIIIRNVTRNFTIRDVYRGTLAHSFSAGARNIDPQTSADYNAGLIYTFNTPGTDSALFLVTSYLITDWFDRKENDTIKYNQVFSNYFAYDDGTSEAGYGINGLGSRNAMAALRFKSYMQDTLRAVSICFNDSYLNSNLRSFDIVVWNDMNDKPGDIIYSFEGVMVEQGKEMNGFYTYVLPDGVMVDDVFYVGWKQRSETFLNAGFDVNTPHSGRQFYWLNGQWYQSMVNGSIMIRPITGPPVKTTSSDDSVPGEKKSGLKIWPNPANDFINIESEDLRLSRSAFITIIDLTGRPAMKVPYNERIDVSMLKAGIYSVLATINNRPAGVVKLVIYR